MSGEPETVSVPHLGGSTMRYKFGKPCDPSLPTLVIINSFTTSMDRYGDDFCTPTVDEFSAPVGDHWVITDDYVAKLLESGLGDTVTPEEHAFWLKTYRNNHAGDAGRKRILVSAINLRDRDGLHAAEQRAGPGAVAARHQRFGVLDREGARGDRDVHKLALGGVACRRGWTALPQCLQPADVNEAVIEFADRWNSTSSNIPALTAVSR
jgi:hypothetical protein